MSITACQRCGGTKKLYEVFAKCRDLYHQSKIGSRTEHSGYVPEWIGGCGSGQDAGGDYVEFTVCRHCGQIQGRWPDLDPTMNPYKYGKVTT